MQTALIILGLIITGAVLFIAIIYNALVNKRNMADNAFATIEVMLKKRFDLIPNLVETVKGYASHERETLQKVIELRTQMQDPKISEDDKIQLGVQSYPLISRIMMLSESYPQLKANENFIHLQRSLNEIEEQISAARRAYNAAVTELNNACEMFPSNIFASIFGVKKKSLFSIPDAEKSKQEIKF